MVVVNHGEVDVFDFVVCGQRQDNQLHDWHHQNKHQDGAVPENLPEFFLQQEADCSHSNRILKLFKPTTTRNRVMPHRMSVSFHTPSIPTPLIMMDLTIL